MSAIGFGGTSAALASSEIGTQNPDLTVAVSLVSSGANADMATVGDSVTASSSVRNNTARYQIVQLSASLQGPAGAFYALSKTIFMAPGQKLSLSSSFPVSELFPLGSYTVSLSAANSNGKSSAAASLEIY